MTVNVLGNPPPIHSMIPSSGLTIKPSVVSITTPAPVYISLDHSEVLITQIDSGQGSDLHTIHNNTLSILITTPAPVSLDDYSEVLIMQIDSSGSDLHMTPSILITDSPTKSENPDLWMPELDLSFCEKRILESTEWLNDKIITAAQNLLLHESNGEIAGFQYTLRSEKPEWYRPLPNRSKYVQLFHTSKTHWITTSNIKLNGPSECFSDAVQVFDSGRPLKISLSTKSKICSFVKPKSSTFSFDIMNVDGQRNSYDCGVYAIAYATHLVNGLDPVQYRWDSKNMRSHLLDCFLNKEMKLFPTLGKRKTALRSIKSHSENIYCYCRLPNDPSKEMIRCDACYKWFHITCIEGPCDTSDKWLCLDCEKFNSTIIGLS